MDTLIGSLAEAVAARVDQPLAASVDAALGAAGDQRLRRMARAGFHARAVELERFEPARAPMLWLTARMHETLADGAVWSDAAAGVAEELARGEPPGRPEPDDERAVTWKVPGPGGHVRHYLALRTCSDHDLGEAAAEAKRAWLVGFFVHCCAEAAPGQ